MNGIIKVSAKTLFLVFTIFLAVFVILFYSSFTVSGIADGLLYSVNYLIPSLFPFMVISSFTMYSGAYRPIGKIFSLPVRCLFRLPRAASAAVILGLVGGFPVGAKCVSMLYSSGQITQKQAERMMTFCVCSGPAFLITAVGTVMLHNTFIGIILYVSQLISALMIGTAVGLIDKKRSAPSDDTQNSSSEQKTAAESLISSCLDAAYSVLELTSLVAIFSVSMSVIMKSGLNTVFSDMLTWFGIDTSVSSVMIPVVFEVTGACRQICSGGCPLWVLSFAVGFGGLCVHMQILHILKNVNINKPKFFLFRFINAVLSSVITYIICFFYHPISQTFAVSENTVAEPVYDSYIGAAALIVMCIIFLLSLKRPRYASFPTEKI